MTKPTEDKTVYASGRHFNGSQWVTMPPGIFNHIKNRQYVDEDGKGSDWNPNYPNEHLPQGVKPNWWEEKETAKAKAGK